MKYGNIKLRLHGHVFDSKAEGRRYRELLLLEKAGEITDLQIHPRYLLQEDFTDGEGVRIRPIHYTADFAYRERGRGVVEDVKSPPTRKKADYVMRVKLFKKRYPDVVFKEIT